ncbi:hypothetical protein [Pseudoflavonifractor sp. An184]|nr:hypothetical protein [Pseudoflavonifractor sp. An184]
MKNCYGLPKDCTGHFIAEQFKKSAKRKKLPATEGNSVAGGFYAEIIARF